MALKKGWKIAIASALAIVIAGTGIYYARGGLSKGTAASSTSYQIAQVSTGTVEKSITASGSLSAQGNTAETADIAMTIDTVLVEAGQTVAVGDEVAKVNTAKLSDTILTLQSEIDTLDTSLAKEAAAQETTATVKSQVAGRVKQILAEKGDSVDDVVDSNGGLILLSTDGRMKIECTLDIASSVEQGNYVTVKIGKSSYTGLVGNVSEDGTSCIITLTDNGPKLGAEAVVYKNGAQVGKGTIEINQPYYVSAEGGIISNVNVSLNQKITTSTSLLYLKSVPVSTEYVYELAQRDEKLALIKQAKSLAQTGVLLATQEGTIDAVSMEAGQSLESGAQLYTLLTGSANKLEVSVDELDIGNIQLGQMATVAVDAYTDKGYNATVEGYSKVGTASNGVTTYTVTLSVEGDEGLLVGMNATATIVIEKKENLLLLPMEALQTVRGEQYVWLYTGELPEDDSADPGTRTVVTTGLSDDENVEITSGLSAEDQVVIVRTKSTSSNSSEQASGMGFPGMGGDMGGQASGQRPSGNSGGPNQ